MDTIQKTIVLDFNNDTLQYLRKLYNLDTPKRMTEALDNLQSWIDKQRSIERAKKKLDKMCTLRSILPQYFGVFNPKEDLQYFSESIMNVLLPKLTDDHYRIYIFKPVVKSFKMPFLDFYKLFAMMCEYILATDYANGFIAILDYTDINLMEVIKNLNLVELQHILKIVTEGYGLRIKSLNIISTSKAVDTLMSLLKQVLSEKLIGRVHVFKDYSGLYGEVPQQILPSDCGGEEISIKELNGDNYLRSMVIGGKGSVERAKSYIDRICTLRTTVPQCFGDFDVKKDLNYVFESFIPAILPNLIEYIKGCDPIPGYEVVLDLSGSGVGSLVHFMNTMELRNAIEIYLGGYGMKMKGLHFITTSKIIDAVISILKQIFKPKLISRIFVHKNYEQLYDAVERELLPKDLGGDDRSLSEINIESRKYPELYINTKNKYKYILNITVNTMESLPKCTILKFHPDTLEQVRKAVNFDKPEEIRDALNILKEWIKQQPHLLKKDFKRAKKQIDSVCTIRTLLPRYFGDFDIKKDFARMLSRTYVVLLPRLTKKYQRVSILKIHGIVEDVEQFLEYYRYSLAEYAKTHDYVDAYQHIIDMTECNLGEFLAKANPLELRQIGCYGIRLKGIHIISKSKLVQSFLSILKLVLKPKLIQRLQCHENYDEILKLIGEEVLPIDFGGTEQSLADIQNQWIEVLSSPKHREYVNDMNLASTDESLRPKGEFNEEYAGLPGTFRALSVD
ncbi:unnamed protein product [Leptidea sinapis]|uniref:CRAL-TRIO domain-containing protein n=1 Tax=Leptidea sinapis TaxID=189913 RepID=A0A5E4QCS1_9NEOP|nr:unnamed protein product [Leptidea sinapis]